MSECRRAALTRPAATQGWVAIFKRVKAALNGDTRIPVGRKPNLVESDQQAWDVGSDRHLQEYRLHC